MPTLMNCMPTLMRSTCICLVNDIWTTAVPGLRYCYTDISAIPLKRRSGARYNMYQPRDCWYLVQRCSLVQIAIWVVLQGVTTLSVIPWHTIQCATAGNKTQQHIVWRGIWYALLHLHSEHVDSSSRWRSFQSASISAALASCFSLSSSGYHDTYYRLQRQAMDSKENGAAVAHTTYSTVYLGNTEPTHRFSSITTTTDYPPSVYCDEPQVMDSCKLAKCHLHRFAASAAVELAPTILPNQSQSVDLQLLQQYSTCRDGHVAGHQFSFCARSTGPTCPQQQSDVITLYCSSSHSATSTASCASESTDTLQGVSALACSGQAHICSGPTAVTAVPASCIGHRHTCMGPCIVRSETMASEQSADTLWDATDSYMQLCNNTAEGSAVITAADSKQQAQQMPWDASRTATTVSTGSTSVQRRLLLTDLAVYPDSSWSSGTALAQANKFMADIRLPDGITYMPVHEDSFLFKAAAAWQFPAFVICLGSSYLQRMMARLPQLAEAMLACPGFEDYSQDFKTQQDYTSSTPQPPKLHGKAALTTTATLRSIQLTCLFLATKVADQVHALELLRFMLSQVSCSGCVVSEQEASEVELRCLDALDWRLGPYFADGETLSYDLAIWMH